MDLANVIPEIALLRCRIHVADRFESLENWFLENSNLQFQKSRKGVAHKIEINKIANGGQLVIRSGIPYAQRSVIEGISAKHAIGAQTIPINRVTIGGKRAQPKMHDPVGN